ncbi:MULTISPECIES: phosphoribosylanthranilate isomerase [unclassified Rhizobium]|uniref:phosphoribosylanthranilate isomerase n=1 Tax=unclassified Rhizobium TaxID=2613769 RepID=UPI0011606FDC|nr:MULTISPECIES: phosphoribosylanthranilate isomerase [unclassified Rhizobium]MBZ5760580.1 phosphoribosylanthranilate isomerase [Rhizobium sp. VS19-DR96]MBZ5765636.1 phosphoribosylanthranilate isomerase [Rhizobium sp. VS19-DR129.2]MBZ5774555.1 phosphoribosylanthranilate isomerase [Rhizobium sp. VS19-DRK62.2]MBZ5784415.1 phosphoribosylanthranilate isomerase [Rhizobium sp. VS19-DR121]MBZ5801027.1 phosphoribosylanthranilate isomerase [Rhizobium sp. VS19-DR181]
MKPDIKICGLKTAETVDRAVARGATHIGFIFFEKSPRYIDPDLAGVLADRVRGKALIVAVVVDPDNDDLDEIMNLVRPDVLQLHGHESPERVLTIKALYDVLVMKAFSVRDAEDLRRVEAYIGIADRFLFDAKAPKGSELPGGNGVAFDWSLMAWLDGRVDYMLSGGLNKDNVALALASTKASGIDISSGVESAPGVKDLTMIDEFFDAVASARMPATASGS